MKNTIKTFAILFLLLSYGCKAQQMVQTPTDVYKLKASEQQFINKPLKNLLKEIKPKIKTAFATRDSNGQSFFTFKFLSPVEINQKVIGRKHDSFYVYVKEPADWGFDKRTKGEEFQWTKEDLEKYGNLTVDRIKVIQRIED